MNPSHTEIYRVRRFELGSDGRLRPTALCNYLEDAAGAHADSLGVGVADLGRLGMTWVLAKMRLVLEFLPGQDDDARVHTRPVGVERTRFRRDFTVFVGDHIAARAVTWWVVMNLETRRLERMPANLCALIPDTPDPALEDAEIRPPDPAEGLPGPHFAVRLDDIDQNRHVNNVRLAGFVLEAGQTHRGEKKRLRRLDLVFRAEGRQDDLILCRTTLLPEPSLCLGHGLYRASDGQELVRAVTEWL